MYVPFRTKKTEIMGVGKRKRKKSHICPTGIVSMQKGEDDVIHLIKMWGLWIWGLSKIGGGENQKELRKQPKTSKTGSSKACETSAFLSLVHHRHSALQIRDTAKNLFYKPLTRHLQCNLLRISVPPVVPSVPSLTIYHIYAGPRTNSRVREGGPIPFLPAPWH